MAMDPLGAVRLTLRDLLASRGYASAAVLTLALAIVANNAIFTAVYAAER